MHSNVHSSAKESERQPLPRVFPSPEHHRSFGVQLRGLGGAVLLAFLLLLLCTGFGPPILTDGGYPPLRLAPEHIDALVRSQTVPTVTATSALLVDLQSGKPLFEKEPDKPLPPASTAKLMTALVVVDQAPLDEAVLVTQHAAETEGSRMGLSPGEQLTVGELLQGLLIPSGNDAAVALAEHIAGSEADFVAMMNARARTMGLKSTNFVNVHGLDAPGQTTSAADLAVIATAALQVPFINKTVATPSANVAGHPLQNTNELLGTYEGADGVKTGTTDEAGQCLVASVTRGGRRTLLVELGSSDRFADARKLFDYAADAYQWRDPSLPENALSWVTDGNGNAYRLRSGATSDIFVPAWERPLLLPLVEIQPGAVMTGTAPVGELRWMFGSETVAQAPLSVYQGP
jgi:serine-type D-Ala-D-Ala carboxypeptidase (penicillin-binding protein 5/6)